MALTKISTGGVKDDAVTAGKIPANAVGSSEIADDAVGIAQIADDAVGTAQIADDGVVQAAIADDAVDEARLQISNAGSNGQFLQKQSGNTGGLTWATSGSYTHPNHSGEVTSTADGAQVIADNIVDEANLKVSNSPTNGQFLQAQSGNTGGLTWAAATDNTKLPLSGGSLTGNIHTSGGFNSSANIVTTAIVSANQVADAKGDVRRVVQSYKTAAHTLVVADAGKCVSIPGSGCNIPGSVFTAGDVVSIVNRSGSAMTIGANIGTLYNTADGTTGNRTLAGRGICTVWFESTAVGYISGSGLS